MPEIHLFTDYEDDVKIVEALLARRCRLVPDLKYHSVGYDEIRTVEAFLRAREEARQFFILRDDFSRLPLEIVSNQSSRESFLYIMPRNGGPALDFLCGGSFHKDAVELVSPAELHYYPTYWDTRAQVNRKAPREEVGLFQQLRREIKAMFTPVKLRTRTCWIGPHARERVRRGASLVGISDSVVRSLRMR